jgi:hypothetical protein
MEGGVSTPQSTLWSDRLRSPVRIEEREKEAGEWDGSAGAKGSRSKRGCLRS